MDIRCFSLRGYMHLYRSLMRFAELSAVEAQDLVYWLNTANLDSFRNAHPLADVSECSMMKFIDHLDDYEKRPYHTEVQLYKSLETIRQNIDLETCDPLQNEAALRVQAILYALALRFYRVYGMEINDPRTVYSTCAAHLIPAEDEPSVCLYLDWLTLPSA